MKKIRIEPILKELKKLHPQSQSERMKNGLQICASLWQSRKGSEDGSEKDFKAFCLKHYTPDGEKLEALFQRLEGNFEALNGHTLCMTRKLSEPLHLDLGDPLAVDHLFAEFSPSAHLIDDLFKNKIAFVMLLNFPPAPLKKRLKEGGKWSRREWAEAQLSAAFQSRVPASVNQKMNETFTRLDDYINNYNIHMDHVSLDGKTALFPEGLKLISHWGLRDELKAQYSQGEGGFQKQETLYRIMQRILDGSIPLEVINQKKQLWNPLENKTANTPKPALEKTRRYEKLKLGFDACRMLDSYSPIAPTHILRRFELGRQIPETEFEKLITTVLSSPLVKQVGQMIEGRLGRKLKPWDIWYAGFKARSNIPETELDKKVQSQYANLGAFKNDIPGILNKLGFNDEDAQYLAAHIEVDPARGAGHAMGAEMKTDCAHLRTRVPQGGMNYKGFNIAMHELGHCVEQVLTLNRMDYYTLRGVPNTAFTEAFAFLFQSRDLGILGLDSGDEQTRKLRVLDTFWSTYEIGGVGLVDMRVWRWMYKNPKATPAQLQKAVLAIACEVWNKYFAPVFGMRNEPLLAIYSHMIDAALYLPDYSLGFLICLQIEEQIRGKNLASEMARMCSAGMITPNEWMKNATGLPLSAEPLLKATERALG